METNAEDFAKRVRGRTKDIPQNVWNIMRVLALSIHRELVLATPVDTGRARSNWRVGVGRTPSKEIEPYAPGEKLGIAERANAQAAIDAAHQRLALPSQKPRNIFIGNKVPYLWRLNTGFSSQASPGFIQKSILRGVAAVDSTEFTILGGPS